MTQRHFHCTPLVSTVTAGSDLMKKGGAQVHESWEVFSMSHLRTPAVCGCHEVVCKYPGIVFPYILQKLALIEEMEVEVMSMQKRRRLYKLTTCRLPASGTVKTGVKTQAPAAWASR